MAPTEHRRELQGALQRFFDLSTRDQLAAYEVIRDYLAGTAPETAADQELRERAESLEALEKVAQHLRLPAGQAPTSSEFNEHAPKVAPGWSSSRVQRLWGRWRFARDAYEGGHVRQTSRQREIRRLAAGKRTTHEDHLTSLRLWLRSGPQLVTRDQYDQWRTEFNDRQAPGERPLAHSRSIARVLRLNFGEAIKVARGEVELEEVQRQHRERVGEDRIPRETWSRTPHEFVSVDWIAEQQGLTRNRAAVIAGRPVFPRPVATFSRMRVWLKGDVEMFFRGEPVPARQANELQHLYLSAHEVAAMLERPQRTLNDPRTITPDPAGCVVGRYFYLRREVEQWIRDNPRHLGRRAHQRLKSG